MRGVRITQAERKIESAFVILSEDVELAFRRAPIAGAHLVTRRAETQSDPVSAHQLAGGKQEQPSLSFLNHDFRIAERQLQWRTILLSRAGLSRDAALFGADGLRRKPSGAS